MKFLHPGFLWAFAVLLIPIIIHLFNFKRYKTLYFSSLQFVKHVDQKTRSTQRLRHLLILLSRVLAFSFLVLAFAQPYVPGDSDEELKKENIVSIFIDNSFSMQSRGIEGELLSEARETARSVIEKSPLGTSFVIGTNEMSGVEQRKLTRIEALDKLDQIDYSPLVRTLSEIVQWQKQTGDKINLDPKQSRIQSVILSDFQKTKGAEQDSDSVNVGNFNFYPVQLIAEQTDNLYIDSVWFSSPIRRIHQKNELMIRVLNTSEEALQNVEITVTIDKFQKTFFVDIPPKQAKETSITYSDKTGGFKSGMVTVADNNVLFDDTYHFSYSVRDKANILLLNGADFTPNTEIVLSLEDFYVVETNDISSITLDNFRNKDLVIVNGANEISTGVANYLTDFYENGGSLALFPGKNPDRNGWNSLLATLNMPGIGKTIESGTRIKSLNYQDPFIAEAIDNKSDRLNLPSVSRSFLPSGSSGSGVQPLITMQNSQPLLSYRKGIANVYLFHSAVHADWGSFSKDPLFSTCILRMSELSQRIQPIALTIGQQSSYPVFDPIEGDESIHLIGESVDFIPQSVKRSGITYISLNQFQSFGQLDAGNYRIEANDWLGNLALNYDRKESNLSFHNKDEIKDILGSMGAKSIQFKQMDGVSAPIAHIELDKLFGYWKICIAITLIFVLAEMLLVRFWK